ncbi:MAG: bisanhydrobacterioruberin hydratase CruF [Bacteroidota bacterium]
MAVAAKLTSALSLSRPTASYERLERGLIWTFVGTIAFSLAGTALLRLFPSLMGVFGPIYPWLVKSPTWTFMTLMPIISIALYGRSLGWANMGFFFAWGSLIGGISELVGTTTGIPFGNYVYTEWLGAKMLDHVPYFIPASWFAMSIICYDLSYRLTDTPWGRIIVASVFMVLWDFSLDPAMNRAFPFWVYPEGGFLYGMPASNWAGWMAVSVVIMWGYEYIGGGLPKLHRLAPMVFFLNCLFPLGISALYGLHAAVLLGVFATAIPLLAVWGRSKDKHPFALRP